MDSSVLLAVGGGVLAVLFAGVLTGLVLRLPPGNQRMVEIASAIQEGASAYLNRQYLVIAIIGVLIAIVIGFTLGLQTAILYLVGAACSATAGYVGMNVSVRSNLRTAEAARDGVGKALGNGHAVIDNLHTKEREVQDQDGSRRSRSLPQFRVAIHMRR